MVASGDWASIMSNTEKQEFGVIAHYATPGDKTEEFIKILSRGAHYYIVEQGNKHGIKRARICKTLMQANQMADQWIAERSA